MPRTTRKISGPALGRYLNRFFADEVGLPVETAEHLALRARATFSSIRVRVTPVAVTGVVQGDAARSHRALKDVQAEVRTVPPSADAPTAAIAGPVHPVSTPVASTGWVSKPALPQSETPPAFDAYAIGLVPTFQREGREGLIGKLTAVGSADDLRKMARAQQIVLPEPLRQGDVTLDALRAAIADSVEKRITDRKAAAR